jgi:hypothetical protein
MLLAAQQQKALVKNMTDFNTLAKYEHSSFAGGPGLHNFLNMRKQSSTAKMMPTANANASAIFGSTAIRHLGSVLGMKADEHEGGVAELMQVSGYDSSMIRLCDS